MPRSLLLEATCRAAEDAVVPLTDTCGACGVPIRVVWELRSADTRAPASGDRTDVALNRVDTICLHEVTLTSVFSFLHSEGSSLAVDSLRVSDGDAAVQPGVQLPQDLTAEMWRHGVV